DTQITATSPAQAAGAVHVTVTTAAGTSALVAGDQFTFVDASSTLTLLSVDPGTGSSAGGTTITVTGSSFQTGATVTVGGSDATNVTVLTTTRLTAVVPAHASGVVNVVVTSSDGASATLINGFSYVDCPNLCVTYSTAASFQTGTVGAGTTVSETSDGEINLAPTAGAEFSGTLFPSGWVATPWTAGGTATVGGGNVALDGVLLTTGAFHAPGRAIEFVATFNNAPHQHIGLGIDLNNTPWAIFSTGASGAALFARTNGSSAADTQISGSWLGAPHRYRIEWTSTNVNFFIDGVEVATHAISIPGEMRPVASDGPLSGAALSIDWIRMSPYAGSGSYTSRVIDAGGAATWDTLSWSADIPAGATLNLAVRAGNTPTPDETWTTFTPVAGSGAALGLTGRFLQYRADPSTADPNVSAALRDLTIAYTVS
ncbi:MAG: IPT/TIG domain-containing protein, partial [Vicinamibacterales bacterium]